MTRKYLDEINMHDRPDLWNLNDSRQKLWEDQRNTYGFDERETWSLNLSWHLWLYERLKMYLEYMQSNNIDLEFHKFKYKRKKYTQKEMIDMMLERLEYSFSSEYNNLDEKQRMYVGEIEEIWAKVTNAMWW